MHAWMGGWLDGYMDGWLDGWLAGWMDGWLAGWMDGCIDGWIWPVEEEDGEKMEDTKNDRQTDRSSNTGNENKRSISSRQQPCMT